MKRFVVCLLVAAVLTIPWGFIPKVGAETSWNFISEPRITSCTLSEGGCRMSDFVVDSHNPQHLIILCEWGAWKESFDGGRSWMMISKDKFGLKPHENMLTRGNTQYVNGVFYFLVWENLFMTTDWINFQPVLGPLSFKAEDIWAGIQSYWTDGEKFYIGEHAGIDTKNGNFFFYSPDGGKTWEDLSETIVNLTPNYPYYRSVYTIYVFQNKLIVDSCGAWWVSNNERPLNFHKLFDEYFSLYELNNRLWAKDVKTKLWESLDGERWSLLTDKVPIPLYDNISETFNDIIYCEQSHQYVIATDTNILVSEDGKSWQFESEGLEKRTSKNATYNQLCIVDNKIYTVFNGKLYKRDYPFLIKKNIIMKINDRNIIVNGRDITMEVAPIIKNDRTLLPLRFVAEGLGAEVGWNNTTKKVTISLNNTTIELWIGKSSAQVNGVTKLIDAINSKVVPVIINGRTMVPIRFISENLGCTVFWSNPLKLVVIQG